MAGAAARKPTAVLVVSAWQEGVPSRVVARITYTLDVTQSHRLTVTVAGVDEIATVVRRWLDEVSTAWSSGDAIVTEE
jgi:hypothetical protein